MEPPHDLRRSPWPHSRRPDPPTEGCKQGIQIMTYKVRLEDGTFKLYNYRGVPLLEWDDWDELLEYLNVTEKNLISWTRLVNDWATCCGHLGRVFHLDVNVFTLIRQHTVARLQRERALKEMSKTKRAADPAN